MGVVLDVWSYLYYDVFHENEFKFYVVSVFIAHLVSYWSYGIFFTIVDITGWPRWIQKYKIQPGVNQPVDAKVMPKVIATVFTNEIIISMLYFVFILYPIQKQFGYSCKPEDLPSVWRVLRDIAGCIIFAEVYFYHSHRLFHWGPLYRWIHKKHHEWRSPLGVAAIYCHPLEQILVNLPTYTIAPMLLGSHLYYLLLWYGWDMHQTVVGHSNYHLPFMFSPEWHDYHHYSFNENYGTEVGFFDWLYGTSTQFKKTKARRRDVILFGLRPARVLWPDDKKTE